MQTANNGPDSSSVTPAGTTPPLQQPTPPPPQQQQWQQHQQWMAAMAMMQQQQMMMYPHQYAAYHHHHPQFQYAPPSYHQKNQQRGGDDVKTLWIALTLAGGHGGNGSMADGESNNATIFVGGLDADVTEEDLMQPFSHFGEVVSVKIPVGKGCGFIQFGNRQSAEEAIGSLNGTVIGKNTVRLSWGRSPNKQWRSDSGNQWNGGYSRGQGYNNGYGNQDSNMYATSAAAVPGAS
ncbi:hypothetical protein HID58_066725 [Brassica napus]|uniref:RRM domain-containing protein n=1 Tax=Brassica napus TaxID=3708 RepID=A0ABQ7ZGJ2_BRANA|nr:hypothetical protein HID58_066725 [Brassica napus]